MDNEAVNKFSMKDPMPTWLLKSGIDLLAPYITSLFNSSLSSGAFPTCYKCSVRRTAILELLERRQQLMKDEQNRGETERERASRASTTPGATAPPLHHGLERSIARRLTEERWRKRGEESVERTTEGP